MKKPNHRDRVSYAKLETSQLEEGSTKNGRTNRDTSAEPKLCDHCEGSCVLHSSLSFFAGRRWIQAFVGVQNPAHFRPTDRLRPAESFLAARV